MAANFNFEWPQCLCCCMLLSAHSGTPDVENRSCQVPQSFARGPRSPCRDLGVIDEGPEDFAAPLAEIVLTLPGNGIR